MMTPPVPPSLVPYEDVLHRLLAVLTPVCAQEVTLSQAEGRIAAGTRAQAPIPAENLARLDGYAVAALDLVGATAFSPVPLSGQPSLLSSGDPLPEGTDAILPLTLLERRGPFAFALGEVLPGEGVLRQGEWATPGGWIARPGLKISGADLMLAEEAGITSLAIRSPRVTLIDMAGSSGASARHLRSLLHRSGAEVRLSEGESDLIALSEGADLLITIGGTGSGPKDRTAEKIAAMGELLSQGIGFSAAPTLATGRVGGKPVIALPSVPEAAIAGAVALLLPALAKLSGQSDLTPLSLPLRRKVTSNVGQAELLFLAREEGGWHPFPAGPLSPEAWRRAEAWRMIGAGEEGWAEGTPLAAALLDGGLPR